MSIQHGHCRRWSFRAKYSNMQCELTQTYKVIEIILVYGYTVHLKSISRIVLINEISSVNTEIKQTINKEIMMTMITFR